MLSLHFTEKSFYALFISGTFSFRAGYVQDEVKNEPVFFEKYISDRSLLPDFPYFRDHIEKTEDCKILYPHLMISIKNPAKISNIIILPAEHESAEILHAWRNEKFQTPYPGPLKTESLFFIKHSKSAAAYFYNSIFSLHNRNLAV